MANRFYVVLFIALLFASQHAAAQVQLSRHVVASGGSLAQPNGDATMLISATVGQAVIFRQIRPDNVTVYQGFWIPVDFGLVGVDEEDGGTITGDVSNYPNPFAQSTTIRFSVPMDGRVTIRVYNIVGILVRTITSDLSAAGAQEIVIQSTDDLGAPLATGTYLYDVDGTTVSGMPFRRTQRLSILR